MSRTLDLMSIPVDVHTLRRHKSLYVCDPERRDVVHLSPNFGVCICSACNNAPTDEVEKELILCKYANQYHRELLCIPCLMQRVEWFDANHQQFSRTVTGGIVIKCLCIKRFTLHSKCLKNVLRSRMSGISEKY